MVIRLLSIMLLCCMLLVPPTLGQSLTSKQKHYNASDAVLSRMLKAFGGKKNLEKMEYVTYALSRKAYQDNGDTAQTQQLWYVHLKKPLVIRLDIGAGDTTTYSTSFYKPGGDSDNTEQRAVYEGLLRSRFFNFLYLLTSPEAAFAYVKPYTYHNNQLDIIRASSRAHPQLSIDLFVNRKGEIVTSSSPNPASGAYTRFADEHAYVKVTGKIVFPVQYRVVQQDKVLAEGLFSDMQINKLSPFWQRQLQLLGIAQ